MVNNKKPIEKMGRKTSSYENPIQKIFNASRQSSSVEPIIPFLQKTTPQSFFSTWIQSPMYRQRGLSTGYVDDSKASFYEPSINKRISDNLAYLENLKTVTFSEKEPSIARPAHFEQGIINVNPRDLKDDGKMVIAHEWGHVGGAKDLKLSQKEQGIIKESFIQERPKITGVQGSEEYKKSLEEYNDWYHLNKPQEVKADLDALRYHLYDEGIYNILEGNEFTEKHLEEAKKKFKDERVLRRLEKKIGKDNLIKLMNTLAQSNENIENLGMTGQDKLIT